MKKYVVTVSSLTLNGKVIRKGKEINLTDEAAKPLVNAKSIELVKAKETPVKKEK